MPRSCLSAAVVSAALLASPSAFAEVCDKITDRWNPADGPITIPQEAMNFVVSPLTIILVMGAVLSIVLRRAAIGYFIAAISVGLAILILVWGTGELEALALREGCITGFPTEAWMLAGIGLISLIAGWYAGKTRKVQ